MSGGICPRVMSRECPGLHRGSWHNVDRLTVRDIQVLSSIVDIISSARDIGVVIDSQLSVADHVVSVCHSAYKDVQRTACNHLRHIRPTLQSLSRDAADISPGGGL